MTSPGEHTSRYRAIGEFDSLVRAAREAKRALKELREEEAKLNAQSLADDKKIAASKKERAKAETSLAESTKKSFTDLNKDDSSGKAGESAGTSYSRGVGKGIQKGSQSGENKRFLESATNALRQAFANAGDTSGTSFIDGLNKKLGKNSSSVSNNPAFTRALQNLRDKVGLTGEDTGNRYITGFAKKMQSLNSTLSLLGFDKLDLDVDIDDAQQSIAAIELELKELSHTTASPQVRIDSTRALNNLRDIKKLFKDEVADDIVKESNRIREELTKIDSLPSGKSFKFWALTALSDMSRVFEEADRGVGIFNRLRLAAASGGGGGNFFKSFVSGFDEFSESSSQLLQNLGKVSGELYRMPGLIAVLISSLPALVAGFGAIGGGALALGSGLGATLGLLAAGPGIITAFIGVTGGLSSTFGGLADVLKNARQAQEQEAEAKEKARLGTEKALTATQKYQLALRDLDPATQKVTEAIVQFSMKWADTQKIIGNNFFKEVAGDTDKLNKLLPIAENFFGKSATALGKVADQGIRMITSGPWKRDFATIAENNATVIGNMGTAGLSLATVFKNIAVAAGPFTNWLTKALKEGAKAFEDWSDQARSDGTIADFLMETEQSLKAVWQIVKNLGNVVNSFFQSTVDEGQSYLRTLGDITEHWADVAKAQESANSPLREWVTNIRPVLSALGALIGDLVKGLAGLATNQSNIKTMIDLLNALRTQVLPPILEILQHLNDSGIAVTVTKALGDLLEAISTFLDSGATTALTVFVTVLANFAELLFNIASLPVISDILGGIASGVAALAAVSIVARFTGLFKLWDFFTWMTRNRGNLSGAFADAARGVAGLPSNNQAQLPKNIPSSISLGPGAIGTEVLSAQAKATERVGNASQSASGQVGVFSRALSGVRSAGSSARTALSGLSGFLGGPWGIAITAATIGVGLLANHLADQRREAKDTKDAFLALKNAYSDLQDGNTSTISNLAQTDDKLKSIINTAGQFKLNLTDVSGALNGQDQALSRVNTQLDAQIALLDKQNNSTPIINYGPISKLSSDLNANAIATDAALNKAREFKNQINEVASAQSNTNNVINQATDYGRSYQERLAGLTQAQVDSVVAIGDADSRIRLLSNALDTLSSATATSADRSQALRGIIEEQTGATVRANEASESWSQRLLDLKDSLSSNGNSLSKHTREGLRNRDALEEAARATRELYLQDIASGVPMDKALQRHKDRIKELTKEADKSFNTKKEVRNLIDAYGDVPDDVKTKLETQDYVKVYQQMQDLKSLQASLQSGKSLPEAAREVEESKARAAAKGYKTGGPVWGEGTRNSDSIRAWLSNGEFVHPTDSVEFYGLPVMEALRTRKLDRQVLAEALPDSRETQSLHPTLGFAKGGQATWPFPVDLSDTLIKKSWANAVPGLGNGSGAGGWQWQMAVLRKAFPGLPLLSGFRPGSTALSGNLDFHSQGRAVDLPPRRDVAAWIRANYGSRTKELITPWNDLNLWGGKPFQYSGAVFDQHAGTGAFQGNAHDHWAYNKGGLVDMMNMLGMDNMVPQQSAPLPSTPRTLSPAASSVVNNSTENTRTFGDVIINNPMPERAGDSIRDALYRAQLLL
jgi:hypothetical protein